MKVAFLTATEGVEAVELTDPWEALRNAGHDTELISTESGTVQLFNHLDKTETQKVDKVVRDVSVDDYDALVLPGGVANPDELRTNDGAVQFVKDFVASGKPVAAICHAPWTLVEANVVKGRTLTSWPSLKTDIENAGGTWVDQDVMVDGNLITSRNPNDLPAFQHAVLSALN
ncbi:MULTISPECIES: type 1 glutamine amidotransferase domain-containing protein [Yimella]|uniref:Protease I n=1 Tax=Yimella lutea TaxID=587872 RepID=A0A542EBX5_9MICO|nr:MULTISPECIES: type 1 glutamine amidotransferase domain-containing protein [Yimella]MCG8654106.1 type 1 glutamine amidotransferase [Yimella sp. NH-Cas1]RYG77274.1 type 1 glutamine amidotransferase [Yimella sp. RIT 621]TQJ12821.1 protease I [Yimella lutea]